MRGKRLHIDFVHRKRPEYRRMCEITILHMSIYLSLAVDCGDQTKIALPHFCKSVTDQNVNGIAFHLIRLLRHGVQRKRRLFTMTDRHSSGSNHTIKSLHRFINDVKDIEGGLPLTLFLKLDNCGRLSQTAIW